MFWFAENLTKSNLHYSDVRFDEARAHGAGFYNFSHDEDQRQQEQKTLKKLHEETDAMRILKERKAEKRKKDMAARYKQIIMYLGLRNRMTTVRQTDNCIPGATLLA